jgi:hypothetical protein
MLDHSYYQELTALAAGGHISLQEYEELRRHVAACSQCKRDALAYCLIVVDGLPAVFAEASAGNERGTEAPEPGARERFLARATRAGLRFSPEAYAGSSTRP